MQLRSAGLKDADDETVAALLDLPVQIFGAKMLDPKRGGGVDHVMAGRFDDREVRCCNVKIRGRMWIDAACVAIEVPTTAGIPNSRERTAGCEVVPPVSVTRPAIFVKSTTQAGFVIWQTRMSPSRTSSNSSTVRTTRAIPSIRPP